MSQRIFDDDWFVSDTSDALHCTQATLMMAMRVFGIRLSMEDAEVATGFQDGVETWPYRMFAWLTRHDFDVIHVDAVDATRLVRNPFQELKRAGFDDLTIKYFLEISDFKTERVAIDQGLATGRLTFDVRTPNAADSAHMMSHGWVPIFALNATSLVTQEPFDFDRHMVLCTEASASGVVIQDPGPPSRQNFQRRINEVNFAMTQPAPAAGTITYLRRSITSAGEGDVAS